MSPGQDRRGEAGIPELMRFEADPVSIRGDHILRMHGYADPLAVRPRLRAIAEDVAEIAADAVRGEAHARRLAVVRCESGRLELRGGAEFRCRAFDKYLAGCSEVIAFVLTVGELFDQRVHELSGSDRLLEALFMDSAGWLAVEAVTRQWVAGLRRAAASGGRRLTRRMGPGYSYRLGEEFVRWPLEEQHALFALLDSSALPVKLLDSAAMLPRMSRSGVFGLRPA